MLLWVKVKPGQRLDRVERLSDKWQVRLKAPAVDGKANEHLLEYLSEILGIAKSKIIIKKGHTSKLKCLDIDMLESAVTARFQSAMNIIM